MRSAESARIQRTILSILAVIAFGFQTYYSASTWRNSRDAERVARVPLRVNPADGTIGFVPPEARAAGVRRGDRILDVAGAAMKGRGDLARRIDVLGLNAGDTLALTVQNGAEPPRRVAITLTSIYPNGLRTLEWFAVVFLEFFSRWTCLLLGFYVAFVRPRDPVAWIVLGLMVSFSQVSFVPSFAIERWPPDWRSAGLFYRVLCQSAWGFWMLMFGIYFPDPKSRVRLFARTRWVPGIPVVIFGLLAAIREAATAIDIQAVPLLTQMDTLFGGVPFYLNMAAIAVFFANIPYKAAKETSPDAKRRLRLLFWGAQISLTPFFLILLGSLVTGRTFYRVPPFLLLPALFLLALFPLTLAYVLVIQRAMDVRVVIRQGLRYALATRGVIAIQIVLSFAVMLYAMNVASGDDITRPNRITVLALAIVAIVLFRRVAERVRVLLDRRFFREQVNSERILAELSEQVRGIVDAETLKSTVTRRISEALHVTEVTIVPGEAARNGFDLALPLEVNQRRTGTLLLGAKRSEEPYTHSDIRLLQSVASQTALALENSRLTAAVAEEAAKREGLHREIEIAREVQQRLLPQRKPDVPGLDYFGLCRPAASVGGDCYEYILAPDGRFYLAVGDVAGKGVPAAMLMAGVNSALRGLLAGGVADPGDLLTHLNRILHESMPRNRFVTFALACYHPAERRLSYCSAGHDPILCVRASGEPEWLATRGIGLALTQNAIYRQSETTLHPGDSLLFYTDGVTEARNSQGEDFGVGRLTALPRPNGARDMAESVLQSIDQFTAGAPQHDDITLLAARCVQ